MHTYNPFFLRVFPECCFFPGFKLYSFVLLCGLCTYVCMYHLLYWVLKLLFFQRRYEITFQNSWCQCYQETL
jgi:hypothetical protein